MGIKRLYIEKEQTITTKIKGFVEVEVDYTQIYHNIFNYVKDINDKWSLKYLLWIIPQANDSNMIPHGDTTINNFINELKGERPSIKTIRDAISELVKNKILIKHGYGSYQLNPYVIWSDKTSLREEHFRELKKYGFSGNEFNIVKEPTVNYIKETNTNEE